MNFTFDLDIRAFFGIPNFDVWSLALDTTDKSVLQLWVGFHFFQQISTNSQPRIPLLLCEIPGRHLGTKFSHPQFFSQCQTVSWFMSTSSAVVLTVHLRSDRTSSLTRAALSPVHVADGRPLRCSSPTRVPPSENILCHLVPLTLHNLQWPAEVSNVLWWHSHRVQRTRRWHTAVRRFVLPFA
jgi:hypothetical protein